MISTSRARKILGKEYASMSDSQIEQFIGDLYALADIVTEQVRIKVSNKQLGVIDSGNKESQNGIRQG